jgi:hypothetical protein
MENAPALSRPSAAPPARAVELPPRHPEPLAVAQAENVPAMPDSPSRRTASWLVETYGRDAAEERARAAAKFYQGDAAEAAHWREVLGHIAR